MKRIVKWLLSVVIGDAISFVILLLSKSLHQLVTCAIAAYFNHVVLEKLDMGLLASFAVFIYRTSARVCCYVIFLEPGRVGYCICYL